MLREENKPPEEKFYNSTEGMSTFKVRKEDKYLRRSGLSNRIYIQYQTAKGPDVRRSMYSRFFLHTRPVPNVLLKPSRMWYNIRTWAEGHELSERERD